MMFPRNEQLHGPMGWDTPKGIELCSWQRVLVNREKIHALLTLVQAKVSKIGTVDDDYDHRLQGSRRYTNDQLMLPREQLMSLQPPFPAV